MLLSNGTSSYKSEPEESIPLNGIVIPDANFDDAGTDGKNFQELIEHLLLCNKTELDEKLSNLCQNIILSNDEVLDKEDEGGISSIEILSILNETKRREYEQPMCLFERLLWTLLQIGYKDTQHIDIIELLLIKSNLNYNVYKNGKVLLLLKEYDSMEPLSVKYLQWQIFSRRAETYLETIISDEPNSIEVEEFQKNVINALVNPQHLSDLFRAVFTSGSLKVLKYLIKPRNLLIPPPKPEFSLLVTCVQRKIYVKSENLSKFYECFSYVLEIAKHNLRAINLNDGNTALHLANQFRDTFMIREILKYQPPISVKNKQKQFPISNIQKDDFTRFLDSLITDFPKSFAESNDAWNIISCQYLHEYSFENILFIDFTSFCTESVIGNSKPNDHLKLIKEIKNSIELNDQIDHPVISTLLELQWSQWKYETIAGHYFSLITYFIIFITLLVTKQLEVITLGSGLASAVLVLILLEICLNIDAFYFCSTSIYKFYRMLRKQCCRKDNGNKIGFKFSIFHTGFFTILTLPLLLLFFLYEMEVCNTHPTTCDSNIIFGLIILIYAFKITFLIGYFSTVIAIDLIMMYRVAITALKFVRSTIFLLIGLFLCVILFYSQANRRISENQADNLADNMFHTFIISSVFIYFLTSLTSEELQKVKNEAMILYRKYQITLLDERRRKQNFINRHIVEKLRCCRNRKYSLFLDFIGEKAFIGVNTVTEEILQFDLNPGFNLNDCIKPIGKLPRDVVEKIVKIFNYRKSALET